MNKLNYINYNIFKHLIDEQFNFHKYISKKVGLIKDFCLNITYFDEYDNVNFISYIHLNTLVYNSINHGSDITKIYVLHKTCSILNINFSWSIFIFLPK